MKRESDVERVKALIEYHGPEILARNRGDLGQEGTSKSRNAEE